jgi:transketolase
MRAYEQIRVDVCYQNLDVNFIGVAWWFAYGSLGNTHYGIEDVNLMKWLPNMKILSPADKHEAEICMEYLFNNKWPFFVRLNRWWEPDIYNEWLSISSLEWWIETKQWNDICLISTGNILWTVIKTAELLEKLWISTQIVSLPLIKPMKKKAILKYIQWKKWVFTIEEHTIIWWLGDSIASILAENSITIKFKKFGIPDIFPSLVGNQEYMRKLVGLDEENLSKKILDILS